jgi:arylsulfatase A
MVANADALDSDVRPNIVLIVADDVGCDAIGCYGGESYPTPHIDRLAADGMRFKHCYSMPSCHPTRVCLLTGRYPRRLKNPKWGSFPRQEEPATIGRMMKNAGYATAVAGKWQLSLLSHDLRQPHRLGFDRYALFGWHEGPRYHVPLIFQDGEIRNDVAKRYGPDVYCDVLIDFIKRNKDRRFFAYFPMALCHDVTDDLEQPVPYGPHGRYESFAEMAAEMDRIVGRLISAIEAMNLSENTLILFTGDNGTPSRSIVRFESGKYIRDPIYSVYNGRRVQGGKTQLTDGGTNVPLIATWKGQIQPGQVVDDLVDFSDFLPTLADLSGGQRPVGVTLDGQSFAPRLRGEKVPRRRWAYAEAGGKYWVRDQRYKLYDNGQFFDINNDPFEKNPLSSSKFTAAARTAHEQLNKALNQVASF